MKRWLIAFLAAALLAGGIHAEEINDLNSTDASNTTRWAEGMNPSAVNDGARGLEGLLSRGLKATIDGCTTTGGSSTVYTVADPRTLTAYYDGLTLCIQWHTATGASPTINVDALGAKNLEWPDGTAVGANDLPSGGRSWMVYDGTQFQVLTLGGPPATVGAHTASNTDTLLNKSLALGSNTVTGTTAQFNTALSDGTFATLAGSETLTNKTLTTPIISSISNTGTLTLPTSSDTLVGRATTDTLTNKTLTAPVISTISNTGTVTLFTATDTVVGKATTDTLTNKTFNANGTGNSLSNVDVADLANGTDGELITWSSSAAPATVAVGTSGQVLTSNGSGAAPTFQNGAAKVWVDFNQASVAASLNVTSVTDNGTGDFTVVIATNFSSANYAVICTVEHAAPGGTASDARMVTVHSKLAGSFDVAVFSGEFAAINDPVSCMAFGAQ